MLQGWECPKCKAVWAPHVRQCENCPVAATTIRTNAPWSNGWQCVVCGNWVVLGTMHSCPGRLTSSAQGRAS